MRSSYTNLMQSKYFNPAFNSAIFDGPIRIYFAQFHEALALKIYFMIQQQLSDEVVKAKELAKASGANILILIYHTKEVFNLSFEEDSQSAGPFEIENWNEDVVIGMRGPIEDDKLDFFMDQLRNTMKSWRPASQQAPVVLAEL